MTNNNKITNHQKKKFYYMVVNIYSEKDNEKGMLYIT